jgi:hypothetical protein
MKHADGHQDVDVVMDGFTVRYLCNYALDSLVNRAWLLGKPLGDLTDVFDGWT